MNRPPVMTDAAAARKAAPATGRRCRRCTSSRPGGSTAQPVNRPPQAVRWAAASPQLLCGHAALVRAPRPPLRRSSGPPCPCRAAPPAAPPPPPLPPPPAPPRRRHRRRRLRRRPRPLLLPSPRKHLPGGEGTHQSGGLMKGGLQARYILLAGLALEGRHAHLAALPVCPPGTPAPPRQVPLPLCCAHGPRRQPVPHLHPGPAGKAPMPQCPTRPPSRPPTRKGHVK
jgi:hypothetical protein